MEFTMETTRMFLAVFIVVSIALAIVLFLLSGIGYVLRWMRGGKRKARPAAVFAPPAARARPLPAAPGAKPAAVAAPMQAKLPGVKPAAGTKPAVISAKPSAFAIPAPAAAPVFAKPLPITAGARYRILKTKDAAKFDLWSAKARMGSVRLGDLWEGARLLTMHLAPNEERCVLELRPMKARPAGVICSIVQCGTGLEVGAVGTVYKQEGWESEPPKPIYGSEMKLAAEFDEIVVRGGLLSATIYDAGKKRIGGIARTKDGGWEIALEKRTGGPDDMTMLACAAQLIAEEEGR